MHNVFKVRTFRGDTIINLVTTLSVTGSRALLLMLANESVMNFLRLKGLSASCCILNLSCDSKDRNHMNSYPVNKVDIVMYKDDYFGY